MKRRKIFIALLSPLLARFLPKPSLIQPPDFKHYHVGIDWVALDSSLTIIETWEGLPGHFVKAATGNDWWYRQYTECGKLIFSDLRPGKPPFVQLTPDPFPWEPKA